MNYIVPPKKIVSFLGQNYGAGDIVPGYILPEIEKPVVEVKPKAVKPAKTVIVQQTADTEGA